ncbi:MAG: FecR family protein [Phycisphaeraceae bacterium]|nr:FecR family protein [Phycisphaeraceae bacterium]
MSEPHPLLEAYLNGELDDQGFVDFNNWLREDPEHLRRWVTAAFMANELGEALSEQEAGEQPAVTDKPSAAKQGLMDAEVLDLLQQIEASAVAEPVTLVGELPAGHAEDPAGPTAHDLAAVGRYVLRKAFTNKRVIVSGICSAAAAVFLLVLVLVNPFASDAPDPVASILNDQAPATDVPVRQQVATLTAAYDAQWEPDFGFGVPEPGQALVAGRTLTLKQGIAEITTNRGAVVVVEAPATVELIDSPNALRLHTGKLVGICETDPSKGFLVRTPDMDVTDLGTRFGVSCRDGGTYLRVFEGEVYAAPAQASDADEQKVVAAGESVIVASDALRVERVDHVAERFVATMQAVAQAPTLTGDIRYEPSIPSDLRIGAYESGELRLFQERTNVEMSGPVAVNVIGPGRFENEALQQPVALKPSKVDSYLIHLDTLPGDGSGRIHRATVRFERPIVGVITSTQAMSQTHALLGLPDVRYGSTSDGKSGRYTGLDQSTDQHPETVEVSDDRRTLTLHLSTGDGIDQARVLIESQASP